MGFWCGERYYARSVDARGTERWFRLADACDDGILPFRRSVAATPGATAPVTERVVRAVFVSSKSGSRSMLVGISRRRARGARGAGGVR